jgi:hypothetical protein
MIPEGSSAGIMFSAVFANEKGLERIRFSKKWYRSLSEQHQAAYHSQPEAADPQ